MAQQLLGLPAADALTEKLVVRAQELAARGVVPSLAIVRVGEREDDLSYERGACKRCKKVGINVRSFVLPEDCSQGDVLQAINQINADASIHGCLLFRPLPASLDEKAICSLLDPRKDVDGITPASMYGIYAASHTGFAPCTAEAVVELLDHYGYDLEGANVVVVGRSLVIGKPVSLMLQARNATVTMCHTRTRAIDDVCRRAELLVVAAGHLNTVGAAGVAPGQVVVDVGINWDEQRGRLCGDVCYDEVEPIVDAITPVPRGVGSVTTAVLAKHVIEAAERTVA